ncbi:Aldo/keto reductase family protein [Theileria parva strain Muguga]|uniref:Aldo/keto reductase family protein n=1 Tax=Theileria parva strain Muguga TaxID=333668 RepID=UPI001C61737E|nr:Aldo/keto reductase family protein [Theileria parva strain Muguga]EAN31053.2 Aldo/keto reductase family protein [Theileria parva strain Muguga]
MLNLLIICIIIERILNVFSYKLIKSYDKINLTLKNEFKVYSQGEGPDLSSDIVPNPLYQAGIKYNRKKFPYESKNKNILKNLGKSRIDSILHNIQSFVNSKLHNRNDNSTSNSKGKITDTREGDRDGDGDGKGEGDGDGGGGMCKEECVKRSVLYSNLKRIMDKNNFKPEKILRTDDFINGMLYRRLGESDLVVSQLCIGTAMYDNPELIDPDHALDIMETALKLFGINFYDVCEYDPYPYEPRSYLEGHHKTVRSFISRVGRENLVLSGRIASSNLGKYKSSGRFLSWVRNNIREKPNRNVIESAVDNLLMSLGTDYLDILSFVFPYRYVPLSHLGEDTYCWSSEYTFNNLEIPDCSDVTPGLDNLDDQIEALNYLYSKGKIKSVGLSNETVWGIHRIKHHPNRQFPLSSIQTLYNLLHRNETESSGLVEASLKENFNCPIIAYGILAGGILTGKYLDPERINPMGADKTREVTNFYEYSLPDNFEYPEDYGHLSYGPSNSRCNLFPQTYHTHRTVWCQHVTGEYIKLARTHGLTLSQLAHSYTFSRPFICSSIIGPRSIGQLYETISSLNYPVTPQLESDIHEIFLRYRAVTMGGPQFLTKIDDFEVPVSQNDIMKNGLLPIWSGGSHWHMDSIPSFDKLYHLHSLKEDLVKIKRIFGLLDKPNDSNWPNYRCWIERTNEHLPGEYFAVKESKLFSWDTMKLDNLTLVNKTPEEIQQDDTSHFHFYWKSGKVYVGPTSEAIYSFYEDKEAQYNTIKQREESFKRGLNLKQLPDDMMIWSPVDVDLVYKRLTERQINPLNEQELEELLYNFMAEGKELTDEEKKCQQFAYFNKQIDKLNQPQTEQHIGSLDD